MAKVYWCCVPALGAAARHRRPGGDGRESPFEGVDDADDVPFAVADDEVAAAVDGGAYVAQKDAAMRSHPTQITVDGPFFALSNNLGQEVLGTEYYRLVRGERGPAGAGPEGWEDDLFAGLDRDEPAWRPRRPGRLGRRSPSSSPCWLALVEVFWLPLRVGRRAASRSRCSRPSSATCCWSAWRCRLSGLAAGRRPPGAGLAGRRRRRDDPPPEGDLLIIGGGATGVVNLAFLLLGVVAAAFAVGRVARRAAPRRSGRATRAGSGPSR